MIDFDFGPRVLPDRVEFRLWAPLQDSVQLRLGDETHPMQRDADGWHRCRIAGAQAGLTYSFVLSDGREVADPASRFQPSDVHGPSEIVDLRHHDWKTNDWHGRAWEETILYELHVGTFTEAGTFCAAADKLDHLAELGITAVQLMPIADFPGRFGWGYDGVLPYAPESAYGRPEELMAFVDAAHARGIQVFLDVVYNHFGPDGNYFAGYAPLFTEHHHTPWGAAVNYDAADSRPVREFVIQNALYWIIVFRIDGLRLDAVHAIMDDGPEHLLQELARRVRAAAAGRHVHLVVENEENDASLLERDRQGRPSHYDAQWNDDIHHVLHIAATGEDFAYYADYPTEPRAISRALAEGFLFQGEHMAYRDATRGTPSRHLPPTAFVSFIQNHDQIGNRAMGDRMAASRPPAILKAIAAVYLLSPQIPMLFMGEEWGADEPFPYFCDFDDDLNEKVRAGRKRELSRLPGFDAAHAFDPTSPETVRIAALDWRRCTPASDMLNFYRLLIALRHRHVVPMLGHFASESGHADLEAAHVAVAWRTETGARLSLAANLSGEAVPWHGEAARPAPFFALGRTGSDRLEPWSVVWWES